MKNLEYAVKDVRIYPCAPKMQNCTNQWGWNGMRPVHHLFYVLRGHLAVKVDDHQYVVRKHQLVLYPANRNTACWKLPNSQLDLLLFCFKAECEDEDLFVFYDMDRDDHVVSVPEDVVRRLFDQMLFPAGITDNTPFRVSNCAAITDLCSIYMQARISKANAKAEFADVLRYMHEHITEEISLETLASCMYLNPSYFATKFREQMGLPPMKYFAEMRTIEAAKLFEKTDMSVQAVAERMGFSNVYYFRSYFQKHLGLRPEKYREMLAGIPPLTNE